MRQVTAIKIDVVKQEVYPVQISTKNIDDIYNQIFVLSTRSVARFVSLIDQWVIDGAVNTTGLLNEYNVCPWTKS